MPVKQKYSQFKETGLYFCYSDVDDYNVYKKVENRYELRKITQYTRKTGKTNKIQLSVCGKYLGSVDKEEDIPKFIRHLTMIYTKAMYKKAKEAKQSNETK